MKDIEILLRAFAMLLDGETYKPSMIKFLNQFSKKCEKNTREQNRYLKALFESFINACKHLPSDAFLNRTNKRFNIAIFEAVFNAACRGAFSERKEIVGKIRYDSINTLATDAQFLEASQEGTTKTANVETRLKRACAIIALEQEA